MPVVIDYSPVGAAGGLAAQVGANNAFVESQKLSMEQQQINNQHEAQHAAEQEAQARTALQQQELNLRGNGENGPSTPPTGFPQGTTRYSDSQGNSYMVNPQQRQELYNLQASGIRDPEQLAAAERQILGAPNMVAVQRPDGTTAYVPAQNAINNDIRNQALNLRQDEFAQRMQSAQATRDANLQATSQRLQTMVQLAGQRNLAAGDKQRIQLSLQAHQSMVSQAKTHLQTAQQQLAQIMTNTPFDDKAVSAAKDAVEKASGEYDQAANDLRGDIENHIANLQAGGTIGATPAPKEKEAAQQTVDPAIGQAQKLGATGISDGATAQAYMKAAGAGKIATQADVNDAMSQAKGDVAKAKQLLKTEGFVFTKSGTQL